jgi:hypothetical protein
LWIVVKECFNSKTHHSSRLSHHAQHGHLRHLQDLGIVAEMTGQKKTAATVTNNTSRCWRFDEK